MKAITQLTMDNIIIKSFDSISEAVTMTNSKQSKISLCAKYKRKSHNGFMWEFKNKEYKQCEISPKYTNRTDFKYIEQIDILTNEIIATYESITFISKELSIPKSNLINCLKGRRNSCGGFKWKYKLN